MSLGLAEDGWGVGTKDHVSGLPGTKVVENFKKVGGGA